jgi:hypothetical protein
MFRRQWIPRHCSCTLVLDSRHNSCRSPKL